MILLLDVGNTNIYAGLSQDNEILKTFRLNTNSSLTVDELYMQIKPFINNDQITQVLISSVVPKVSIELKKMAQKFLQVEAIIIKPGIKTGVLVKADNPKEVGSDLICVTAGLNSINPTLIIDLGTATKLIYTNNYTILGVVIMPGIQMSISALNANTALLPEVELNIPPNVLGTNTINCIQSGILYGHACAIDGLINKIKKEVKQELDVVLTGGLSSLISLILETEHERQPRLVLEGMLKIYQKNQRG